MRRKRSTTLGIAALVVLVLLGATYVGFSAN